ncbi:MAG: hypothetical protein FWC32_01480 [Firmicutes bacterium]|nr:hypothetical protein [Bacillota bacterium]
MSLLVTLLIVAAVLIAAIIIVCVSVMAWADTQQAKHRSRGPISEELANELKAELAEIKENLAAINKMLREVQ